jgi:hypothetical protein
LPPNSKKLNFLPICPVQLRSTSGKQQHHLKTRQTTSSNSNKYSTTGRNNVDMCRSESKTRESQSNCTIKSEKVNGKLFLLMYAVEVKEFLLGIQRQDHSSPAEPNISCKLDYQSRIPQNPSKIKKKKQILPPCPPQTLEPEKTDQRLSTSPPPMNQQPKHGETLLTSSGRQHSCLRCRLSIPPTVNQL